MKMARVVGTVVASHKDPELSGLKFLLLQPCGSDGKPASGGEVVGVDGVGAGLGDVVLFAAGSSARQTEITRDRPVDATIMAIVDAVDDGGEQVYLKSNDR